MRQKKWHVLLNKEMYAYLMYRVKRKSCLNTYTSEISATDKRIPSLQEDSEFLAISSTCHSVRELVCGKFIFLVSFVVYVSRLQKFIRSHQYRAML